MTNFDNLSQNIFGLTALVISLVALVTTCLQILQQYFSTADGYRRCAESVMGLWAEGTHRKLRGSEFRVEVVFETPVIFLAPPTNDRGPIVGRKIHYIDGTPESYKNTRVLPPKDQEKADAAATARIQTADDERASWVSLLSTLQREELESRKWDEIMRNKAPPGVCSALPKPPDYPLAVGLQSKTRSWDFMPETITRPYATSTICHLIEIMALLGMYWKLFDQNTWNLRAEGNGFILTSTTVHGLGVMVIFATTGKSMFTHNRVIPDPKAVKSMAFGAVPNIFDNQLYLDREKDSQSLELVFGTKEDVETTLESLGCHPKTLKKYSKDHKHMFSLSFEIIGMLAQVVRLRGSCFRMVPNPTSDYWQKNIGPKPSWRTTRLMEVFQAKTRELSNSRGFRFSNEFTSIFLHWEKLAKLDCTDDANLSIQCREAIHDALDERTDYLLSIKQIDVLSVLVSHITKVVDVLVDQGSPLNTIVLANKEEALLTYYFNEIRPRVCDLDDLREQIGEKEMELRNTIWISLLFRMICWFLLHDFDKSDIKIVPSDLKGSRMPVFIG